MDILAVIPARGSSKGLTRKNLARLGGRPLLAYTADCVLGSRHGPRAVLSTEDTEIAGLGRRLGLEVPFRRPLELAGDEACSLSVLQHAVSRLFADEGYAPEWVLLLQPTSPLRTSEHLDAALDMLLSGGFDSLVSLTPARQHPAWAYRVVDGAAVPVEASPPGRRQELPELYHPNGAIYATTPGLLSRDRLLGDRCAAFLMEPWSSVDINDEWDLAVAEAGLIHSRGASRW
ncbi:MAG TPA: acylneuraminate cytidylyltransferase family protein [Candidatus Coatesbacteria bacterium]|nr:acylneuraminate cytidylyltransferase family protein [Candidatus Coatesbacteria bacterium]